MTRFKMTDCFRNLKLFAQDRDGAGTHVGRLGAFDFRELDSGSRGALLDTGNPAEDGGLRTAYSPFFMMRMVEH